MNAERFWAIHSDTDLKEVGRAEIAPTLLPGVKCEDCGKVWGLHTRVALELNNEQISALNWSAKVCSVKEFKELQKLFLPYLPDYLVRPGVCVGRSKIRKLTETEFPDFIWGDGGIGIFLHKANATRIGQVIDQHIGLIPCLEPYQNYIEVIPENLDLRRFGQVSLCNVCGASNVSSLNFRQISEYLSLRANNFLVQLPGVKIVGAGFKKITESLGLTNIVYDEFDLGSYT